MSEVTRILSAIEQGDPSAADKLLPLVYDELRKLAAQKLAHESPGQTLQATALVHEAYLRLVSQTGDQKWDNCGHFFAAAAEAMRRILIENARRKQSPKHGGDRQRFGLAEIAVTGRVSPHKLLELDDALAKLTEHDTAAAELIKLRIFAGLSVEQAGNVLGLSRTVAYRQWTYARAWLRSQMT
jgi:RNA polymerase sigma factor (TIGR02999 family)